MARRWLTILEQHPASWFLIGLLLILLSEGSVRVSIASHGFALLPPSSSSMVRPILVLCGVSLIIAVAHFYIKWRFRESIEPKSKLLDVISFMVWLLATAGIIVDTTKNNFHRPSSNSWSYDSTKGIFSLSLGHEGLRRFAGDSIIMVVRKKNPLKDYLKDPDIRISHLTSVGDLTQPLDLIVHLDKLAEDVKIGDSVEGHVFIVPSGTDCSSISCINDLISRGAIFYFSRDRPPTVSSSVDNATLDAVWVAVRDLPTLEKEQLIYDIRHLLETEKRSVPSR